MTVAAHTSGGPLRPVGGELTGKQLADRRAVLFISGQPFKLISANSQLADLYRDDPGTRRPVLVLNEKANDFRVKFSIKRAFIFTPNLGKIEVYGLNDDSRALCSGRDVRVALAVGFGADIAQAGVLSASQVNHKNVPGWVSTFEGGDGQRLFRGAQVSQSFGPGTKVYEIGKLVGQTLGKLGAGADKTLKDAAGGRVYRNGKTMHGRAVNEFRSICQQLGLEYAVVDEEIILIPKDGTTKEVAVIGPESGLIGSPEYASPPQLGKPHLLRVKMLLNPGLRPGMLIVLKSAAHSGSYQCRDLTHDGDVGYGSGAEWFTTVECLALKGAK